MRVWVDFGVGVVHLARPPQEAEDVLDAAQRLAEAARGMRSRVALADPHTGDPVPAEEATLPPARAAPVLHAVPPARRTGT
jgi:hypothetical protein